MKNLIFFIFLFFASTVFSQEHGQSKSLSYAQFKSANPTFSFHNHKDSLANLCQKSIMHQSTAQVQNLDVDWGLKKEKVLSSGNQWLMAIPFLISGGNRESLMDMDMIERQHFFASRAKYGRNYY